MLLSRVNCVLVIVDIQERLIETILDKTQIVGNIKALIEVAKTLSMPILVTEQEKLGNTIQELQSELLNSPKHQKLTFGSCRNTEFMEQLQQVKRKTIVLCGIETHVCVLQTAIELVEQGYHVLVPRDATSSYAAIDRDTAIERMKEEGVIISTTEAVIYELTERAGAGEFRKILQIVKDRRENVSASLK